VKATGTFTKRGRGSANKFRVVTDSTGVFDITLN
jgi:hypothetical protein